MRSIRRWWPDVVFERGDTEGLLEVDELHLGGLDEFFAYCDRDAAEGWTARGAEPDLLNKMIHILGGPTTLTIVVDDPDRSDVAGLVASLRKHLLVFKPGMIVEKAA